MTDVPERRNFDSEMKKITDKLELHVELYTVERFEDRASAKQLKDSVNAISVSLENINKSISTLNERIEKPLDVFEKVSITAGGIKKAGKFTIFLAVFITTMSAAWYSLTHFGEPPSN